MIFKQKAIRYYYWIVLEFIRKHLRLILLSFFISIVGIVSIISFSPYIVSITTSSKNIVGIIGTYQLENLPDSILSKISSGLVFVNEKGEAVPTIASKWEQSKDGKTYFFYLKKNLYWNDGKHFTAKGINFKFKDVEVKIISDYKIEFRLKKPLPIFPTYLATPIIKYPLVGVAGLYRVERFKNQYGNVKELYLSQNKSNLPYLVYKFYDSENKMINAYKLGEINQMEVSRKTTADFFSGWKNTKIDKSIDYGRLLTLFFNMNNEFLKQKDNRKAIIMAVSRKQFSEEGIESNGPIPPVSWANNPNIKKVSYDPEFAEKIIKKNYESSQSGTLQISTSYDYLDVAQQIKDNLDKIGLSTKISTISNTQSTSFDMLVAYWKVPLDPDQYYFWHSTQKQGNITNYGNVKVDKLLEDGRGSTSLEERKKIYDDFQRVLVDDSPAFFMFYPYTYTIKRKSQAGKLPLK